MYCYIRYHSIRSIELANNILQELILPENTRFYTSSFCNHFLCLCNSLPDTFGMVNANGNVKRVDPMLFKYSKHCLPIKMKLLLMLLFPFVLNTMAKLDVETQDLLELSVHHCVKSVRIPSYSGLYSVQMRESVDRNNSEYGYFSRSALNLTIFEICVIWL